MISYKAFQVVLQSSFSLLLLVIDALHLEPYPPVYLVGPADSVSVPNPFPNMFALKEQFKKDFQNFHRFTHYICEWIKH